MAVTIITLGSCLVALFMLSLASANPVPSPDNAVFEMNEDNYHQVNWHPDPTKAAIAYNSEVSDKEALCNGPVSTDNEDPPHKRSTCPWSYENRHNKTQFPSSILYAIPICPYCIGSDGALECIPITTDYQILTQTHVENGVYIWQPATIKVPIGFTCAGRKIKETVVTTTPTYNNPDYA